VRAAAVWQALSIAGVLLTMAGSLLTGLHDQILSPSHNGMGAGDGSGAAGEGDVQHSVWGDAVSLFSAMMCALQSHALRSIRC
jgi:drug/metabolite transporter (DMT)-like permease